MRRVILAVVLVLTFLTPTPAVAAPKNLGCRYETGGQWWMYGECARVRCDGTYFNRAGVKYRLVGICDRAGTLPHAVRSGPWVTKGQWSKVTCNHLGDMGMWDYWVRIT